VQSKVAFHYTKFNIFMLPAAQTMQNSMTLTHSYALHGARRRNAPAVALRALRQWAKLKPNE
jgi:hypothetical protein